MISRRQLLVSATASLMLPALTGVQKAHAQDTYRLRAEPVNLNLLPDHPPTALWGFNGTTPGPTLRLKKGERLKVDLVNGVDQASSLHWHGIRIANPMDGVPGLTQEAVEPGQTFSYDFVVPDAGTYWYHSHDRSWEQVARGLYGALIVDEENPPPVDHDVTVFIDDWRITPEGQQAGDFDNIPDQAHGGRLGNFARALFRDVTGPLKRNQRIRLRLINVATDRIFDLRVSGITGQVVAYDGMPLATLAPLTDLVLAPAQRIDVISTVTGDQVTVDFLTSQGPYRLGELPVDGDAEAAASSTLSPLEANRYQAPDLSAAVPLTLRMEGGAMSMRMMRGTGIWAFNGLSHMTDTPFHHFQRGQTAVIDLINDTRFPHGIHLHGHHFQALNGEQLSPLRDTILIEAGQQQRIACVFDNPGKWLLHCHMLAHQAAGMKTWVQVG